MTSGFNSPKFYGLSGTFSSLQILFFTFVRLFCHIFLPLANYEHTADNLTSVFDGRSRHNLRNSIKNNN